MPGPSKQVREHLDESKIDEAIDDAQSDGEARLVRRLCLMKNLYAGDSVTEGGSRVGVTQPTASRWIDRWNKYGLDGLRPDFGGGRPQKLSEREQDQLTEVLKHHQPLIIEHMHRLIEEGFGVSYSDRHLYRIIKNIEVQDPVLELGPQEPVDSTEEKSMKRLEAALDELEHIG